MKMLSAGYFSFLDKLSLNYSVNDFCSVLFYKMQLLKIDFVILAHYKTLLHVSGIKKLNIRLLIF